MHGVAHDVIGQRGPEMVGGEGGPDRGKLPAQQFQQVALAGKGKRIERLGKVMARQVGDQDGRPSPDLDSRQQLIVGMLRQNPLGQHEHLRVREPFEPAHHVAGLAGEGFLRFARHQPVALTDGRQAMGLNPVQRPRHQIAKLRVHAAALSGRSELRAIQPASPGRLTCQYFQPSRLGGAPLFVLATPPAAAEGLL